MLIYGTKNKSEKLFNEPNSLKHFRVGNQKEKQQNLL